MEKFAKSFGIKNIMKGVTKLEKLSKRITFALYVCFISFEIYNENKVSEL